MDGIIFDIQRNSVNDGPGIRTTVFLKGCSLNCLWCHNEESKDISPMLRFYPDKCDNCMKCVEVCKASVHLNQEGLHKVDFDRCIRNWDCIGVCPSDALAKTGQQMSVEEVLKIVMKDKDYYANSGGGISISGGEPMVQFSFTSALLEASKKQGIHTCLDTTGYAAIEKYEKVLPLTDIFLFDYKETNTNKHKEYTGVYNEKIHENLKALIKSGAKIILRCPIIPGLNDRSNHFKAISELSKSHRNIIEVHILPYHTTGIGKAEQHGMRPGTRVFSAPSETQKMIWKNSLHNYGCENLTIF